MKQTTVVCLYGGPGLGKSTLAAELFVDLKTRGHSVELVTEYVKRWAWLGHPIKGWEDSLYIFAKQLRAESVLYGKVSFIITDSPIGLCAAYEKFYRPDQTIIRSAYENVRRQQSLDGVVENLDFQLMRQHPYKIEGRYEDNEDQARDIDRCIRDLIGGLNVKTKSDILQHPRLK